ncbi:MAG: YceI family protein [Rhodospirillaceae bacterium]|nr:YceI family protein [Rhodospirillaceae bacterium]
MAAGFGLIIGYAEIVAVRAETYAFDKAHSRIIFFVPHEGLSQFLGQFHTFDGEIEFDPAKPEAGRVTVTIDAASVDMDHQELNERLRGKDFFRVNEFPTLTFNSTSVVRTGEKTGKLTGNLTLMGITKPVTLDVTLNYSGPHPFYKIPTLGLSATGLIDRKDFGLTYRPEFIGDDITIRLEIEAMEKSKIPAAALRK